MSPPDDSIYVKYELIFIVGTHAQPVKTGGNASKRQKHARALTFRGCWVGSHTTAALQRSEGLERKAHLEEPTTRVQNIR